MTNARDILYIVAYVLFVILPLHAQSGAILFQDDFNRVDLGANWQVSPGNGQVGIVNNALQLSNAGGNNSGVTLVAPGTNVRNAAVAFDLDNGGPTRANNYNVHIYRLLLRGDESRHVERSGGV